MLYLGIVFNVWRKHFLGTTLFVLSSLSAITVSMYHDKIESWVGQKIEAPKSFFHAIVAGEENHQRLARKLRELPGVESVNVIDDNSLKAQWGQMIADWGLDDLKNFEGLRELNYSGLKIVFRDALSERSEKLVMEYVQRLAGKDNVTMSTIKRPEPELFMVSKKGIFEKPLYWFYGILGLVWFLSLFNFNDHLQRESYLVETYQRTKNVQLAVAMIVILGCFFIPTISLIAFKSPSLVGALAIIPLVVLTFIVMGLKKWSWH